MQSHQEKAKPACNDSYTQVLSTLVEAGGVELWYSNF